MVERIKVRGQGPLKRFQHSRSSLHELCILIKGFKPNVELNCYNDGNRLFQTVTYCYRLFNIGTDWDILLQIGASMECLAFLFFHQKVKLNNVQSLRAA